MGEKNSIKLVANNKKAYHDYFILEKYEAGISEIKDGEVYIVGMHISPYEKGNIFNKDPLRTRKLLLHKAETRKLGQKIREKGFTLMPLQVYLKGSLVKVEVGLARGKKLYDKRADIAKKDMQREAERDYKHSF